jgi:hypothetical protein
MGVFGGMRLLGRATANRERETQIMSIEGYYAQIRSWGLRLRNSTGTHGTFERAPGEFFNLRLPEDVPPEERFYVLSQEAAQHGFELRQQQPQKA